ncbi:hypothetical protein PRN20_18290 [Devosia sp. ZB163]|uniref:hypothetical protein n=1 Tax=Devosia sp. ZB163 TaxID=3025938 RepID=UPI00235DF277|nr:hypothetical protein [Devosia sp. ZB163]MDC9825688.1 hypothetical protein [Devosia sp. ZB163]
MGSFFASVAVQWFLRRIWEIGGLLTGTLSGLLGLYSLMPPDIQQTALLVLQGNWEDLSLKAAGGFIVWAFVQWRSYRATVKPQVVIDGRQVELREIPQKTVVEELTRTALGQRKETLIEKLLKLKLGR